MAPSPVAVNFFENPSTPSIGDVKIYTDMRILSHRCVVCWVLLLAAPFTVGCVPLIAGGVGAVGGYAVGRDNFEGTTSKSQEEVWEAASKVTSIMGNTQQEKKEDGQIIAFINGARVTVAVIQINLTSTKIRVKARKTFLPRPDIAQDVYAKIMRQLEE